MIKDYTTKTCFACIEDDILIQKYQLGNPISMIRWTVAGLSLPKE